MVKQRQELYSLEMNIIVPSNFYFILENGAFVKTAFVEAFG